MESICDRIKNLITNKLELSSKEFDNKIESYKYNNEEYNWIDISNELDNMCWNYGLNISLNDLSNFWTFKNKDEIRLIILDSKKFLMKVEDIDKLYNYHKYDSFFIIVVKPYGVNGEIISFEEYLKTKN